MMNSQKHVAKHDVGKNHVSLHVGGQMGKILIRQTLSSSDFTQSTRSSTVLKGCRCSTSCEMRRKCEQRSRG